MTGRSATCPLHDNDLGLETPQSISCSCGKKYIGQTGRRVSNWLDWQIRVLQNTEMKGLTVAEHFYSASHTIEFEKNSKY